MSTHRALRLCLRHSSIRSVSFSSICFRSNQYCLSGYDEFRRQSSRCTSFSTNAAEKTSNDNGPVVLYEGPFASLTLKLKRISLTSAVVAIFGLPALSFFYGGDVPAAGQLAVIGTAGITAVGSTVLLGYCFSPYVHTLERVDGNQNLFRIVTRDILARRVESIFDPTTDVSPPQSNNRPFCNFMVNGLPFYVHPELINDYKLRVQLVGEEPQQQNAGERNKKKLDDDEFL